MFKLPLRKCLYVAKVALVFLLVFAVLASIERWRGGKRTARAQDLDLDSVSADDFEAQVLADEARIVPGLGEGGAAAYLYGKDKELGIESEKKLAINVYLSDRIAYNRSLEDHRNPACKRVTYDAELPSASVIIIFHNEPYSVVVRTLHSVINSARRAQPWYKQANFVDRATGQRMTLGYPGQDPKSKFVYLKEIILVDDNSTLPELKGKLSHYIRTRLPPDLIRILRLPERVGLTRARLAGARYATADVAVFLDAHCEGQPDWLRPLLQRIKDAPHATVMPIIDVIDSGNLFYSVQQPAFFQVGGFTFAGHFTWIDIPEREKKRRGSDIAPTWSPTMAGGLFAISREYYWELGAYDEQMAGWGGENLEMSFRIWQCGGTLETIPCSRVGHVFRSFHPYGLPANSDTHGINTARMAEVWMDDYKELFYMHRPDLRNSPKIGDVTHRKVLREKLQCKSFEWYLTNIYKEKFVPVRDALAYGRFRNAASGLCLDTLQKEGEGVALGVYPCHPTLQSTQHFSVALDGQLRDEERCVQLQFAREKADAHERRKLVLVDCSKRLHPQKWRYTVTKQLIHVNTGLCLDSGFEAGRDAVAVTCRVGAPTQRWDIDYSEHNGFRLDEHREMSESELILQKLRGQRRKSRSLFSLVDGELAAKGRRRSHKKRKHKKRSRKHTKVKRSRARRKNKFILKLERTLMNSTVDHLEVEIHCKHRKLYPNNSFVRDLVTILNEKNIKVINNGRIFERNRVVQLAKGKPQDDKVLEKLELDTRAGMNGSPPLSLIDPPPVPAPAPAPTPAPLEEPTPAQPQSTGRTWVAKKHKVRVPSPNVAAKRLQETDPATQKKIIIEDFVEVKASPTPRPPPLAATRGTRPRKKKKKKWRKLQATESAAPALPTPPPPPADQVDLYDRARTDGEITPAQPAPEVADLPPSDLAEPYSSHEAVEGEGGWGRRSLDPAFGMSIKEPSREDSRDSSNQLEVNVLRNQSQAQPRRREHKKTSPVEEPSPPPQPTPQPWSQVFFNETLRAGAGTGADSAPLKVIMKSNVTFNLGPKLLEWHASEDMRKLLGQLTISDNATEWLKPPPKIKELSEVKGEARGMDTLVVDTEAPAADRSASSQMHSAADGDYSSGSWSESAGTDTDSSDNAL